MSRENAHDKGRRLLAEGRLVVTLVDRHVVRARCRGDSGHAYDVGYDGRWHCSCPARGTCSHLTALQLVVVRPA